MTDVYAHLHKACNVSRNLTDLVHLHRVSLILLTMLGKPLHNARLNRYVLNSALADAYDVMITIHCDC